MYTFTELGVRNGTSRLESRWGVLGKGVFPGFSDRSVWGVECDIYV